MSDQVDWEGLKAWVALSNYPLAIRYLSLSEAKDIIASHERDQRVIAAAEKLRTYFDNRAVPEELFDLIAEYDKAKVAE